MAQIANGGDNTFAGVPIGRHGDENEKKWVEVVDFSSTSFKCTFFSFWPKQKQRYLKKSGRRWKDDRWKGVGRHLRAAFRSVAIEGMAR
ncbi:WRKY DNA -binding domain containing protein [Anopheles sinensis]|uniref:WRKY DNA-binding domain containing protein n=1 Tax=Anopheles sinensis TaxID=74873 RepID=A0A084WS62_ANOSI|nr:WRKY DNA -binding domain containing protein [Anopheles sinensis]